MSPSPPSRKIKVEQWAGSTPTESEDSVATEVAVALSYNGISHVVMMATPSDLEQFALGFSLSEQIIASSDDLYGIEIVEGPDGIEINLEISTSRFSTLKERRRNLSGRTGCGLCGAESLEQARLKVAAVDCDFQIRHEAIQSATAALHQHQPLQALTGASHGAAWCNDQGEITKAYEDVGRHNALDKLIGALHQDAGWHHRLPGFLLISSRASYEIVQKSAIAGIAVIAAVSAPTSMAIEIANTANLTLAGFTRPGRHVVYTHGHRLI